MNMPRLSPYVGILLALIVGADVFLLVQNIGGTTAVPSHPVAFPSISVATTSTLATLPDQRVLPATTTQPVPVVSDKKSVPLSPASSPALVSVPAPVAVAPVVTTPADLNASATALRSALVNIMCFAPAGGRLHSISGSGVFIDSKGIILTNAHVAQYFLLFDRGVSCTIRAGSPAADAYKAQLIYISHAWLRANPTVLTQTLPSGTGENDFALLAVTASASSTALPSVFPAISLAQNPPKAGAPVVVASFGAQFLDSSQIQSSLFPTVVFGSIKDMFTFGTNTADVFSLGGSAAAQEGSSGGGVASDAGKLVGTITTSTVEGATATRTLSAITASYIRAEYSSEMGSPIDFLLAEPTATAVAEFAQKVPKLESIISSGI